jgi:hypothetical protein
LELYDLILQAATVKPSTFGLASPVRAEARPPERI